MTFVQDPAAVVDYEVDWSLWLPTDDSIVSASWTVDAVAHPTQLSVTASGVGGSLAAQAYYWVVTALDANGETTPSNEASATWAAVDGSAVLVWGQVQNATGYKVYRGTQSGVENVLVATITSGGLTTYTDTGGAGAAGTPPSQNTAALGITICTTPPPSTTPTAATAFVQGGTVGATYIATCHITTSGGRQNAHGVPIAIQAQIG